MKVLALLLAVLALFSSVIADCDQVGLLKCVNDKCGGTTQPTDPKEGCDLLQCSVSCAKKTGCIEFYEPSCETYKNVTQGTCDVDCSPASFFAPAATIISLTAVAAWALGRQ